MSDEQKTQLRLEIAHVLFMDIVGYSKLLIDEQSEALHELNQIVRNTEAARTAEAASQLIILPTGDGMALVFTGSVEDPVECALQVSQKLCAQPSLPVRMGIHSGPVHHVADVNQRENIAGAGINIAQRVMDCGDAGHILLSKRVADDLAQYRRWQPYLHDLGDFEVKHGVVVSVVNLYADVVGNPVPPAKLKHGKRLPQRARGSEGAKRSPLLIPLLIAGLMLFSVAVLAIIFAPAILKQSRARENTTSSPAAPITPSPPAIAEKSIAVLPFENMSRDPDNAFFTDGVQDQVLTALAKVADLKVISRTSVMQYKSGVARNLREIAQQLGRDSSFFLSQCQLAYAHDNLYFLGLDHTPARLAAAQAAVEAAFRLQPDAGEAHLARAEHLYRGYLDYDGALAELEIARKSLPNDPRVFELIGYIARRRDQQEEGLRNLQRAIELDPRNFFTLQQIALSYVNLRRYSEEAAVLDRALSIKPDDVETKVVRALIPLDWKADTRPLHQALDEIRAKDSEALKSVADTWLLCALAERDVAAAESALEALGDNFFGNDAIQLRRDFSEGLIARMTKNEPKARAAFTAARAEQRKRVDSQPDYAPAICVLAVMDAALGRKEEALREGRRAIELLPVEKDSINGAHMIEFFAITAAWVGDKDLACDKLAAALRLPGTLSYGQLKLLPFWDPLRGDPRFEKIIASLAPKE